MLSSPETGLGGDDKISLSGMGKMGCIPTKKRLEVGQSYYCAP